MRVLDSKSIRSVFSMKDAIGAVREAFVMQSNKTTTLPLRTSLNTSDGKGNCLFMPAYAADINRPGIKIVSVFPENASKGLPSVPATMLLLSGETGVVEALLDGTEITRIRTAAVAAAATELLSRENAEIATIFGTGGQAAAQLEGLLSVRKLKQIQVFDIDKMRLFEFVSKNMQLAKSHGATLSHALSSRAAVEDADIITTVTTTKSPVFDGDWVKPGVHINGIGSYTPEMQELDPRLLERATRIYVDNREAVCAETGDFIIPQSQGTFSMDRIEGELGELIQGKIPGRSSPQDITLFKTVGFATLDVVAAHRAYEKALAAGIGQAIEL